jgi:hypothetical protein
VRDVDRRGEEHGFPSLAPSSLREVRSRAKEECPPVLSAEHAGEELQVLRSSDLFDDLATWSEATAAAASCIGRPDVPVGVERAAVRRDVRNLGPDPTPRK